MFFVRKVMVSKPKHRCAQVEKPGDKFKVVFGRAGRVSVKLVR